MSFSFSINNENTSAIPGLSSSNNPDYGSNFSPNYDKTLSLAYGNSREGAGIFSFPVELKKMNYKTAEIRDFMEIEILEVIGQGFESAYNNALTTGDSSTLNNASLAENFLGNNSGGITGFAELLTNSPLAQILVDKTKLRDRKLKRIAKIWIYEPNQQDANYSLKYSEDDLGPQKKLIETISSSIEGKSIPGSIIKQATTTLISDVIKNATNSKGINLSNLVGGEINLQKYINFKSRSIPTPLLEYTFEGINRRKFIFSWQLYAKSIDEVKEIYHILRLLKKNSHPTRMANDDYYIKYPNIFKIRHLFLNNQDQISENLYLNRIKPCALDNISINYTDSGGFLVFDRQINIDDLDSNGNITTLQNALGKAPIGMEITLQFTELELLLGEDFDIDQTQTNPYQGGGY